MEMFRICGKRHHLLGEIVERYPLLAIGCKSKATFLERHAIPEGQYLHARLVEEVWIPSHGKSKKLDKLFVRAKYFQEHLANAAPIQKQLVDKQIGISPEAIKAYHKASAGSAPCVYLFRIGTVRQMRDSMEIDPRYLDHQVVCKFGMTRDLPKRTGNHAKTFRQLAGSALTLLYHAYIDPKYVSKAEVMVKETMQDLDAKLEYGTSKELVVLDAKQLARVKKQYDRACQLYRGRVGDLTAQLREYQHTVELERIQHALELQQKCHECEILRLKLTVAELRGTKKH